MSDLLEQAVTRLDRLVETRISGKSNAFCLFLAN